MKLIVPDLPSFLYSYHELFVDNIYKFESNKDTPVIVDIGANIGLSILYFKKLYPKAKITAYEADPYIFACLKQNLENNHAEGVVIENKAVWIQDTKLAFFSEKADSGRIETSPKTNSDTIEVDTVDVKKIVKKYSEIDLLKIDIEGAEHKVIPECSGLLGKVRHIFVEYHSVQNERQNLDEILNVLISAGFTVNIQSINHPQTPFVHKYEPHVFNMQLNIFGKK
ncbi:MAG: FkbM family methyltransferase [Victivallaceae bacterium]|nr:FkbM family methyltransferase [Victivallaceae bacterium]